MSVYGPTTSCLAASFDAGRFVMDHPDLAAWCMGAVKSSLIVLMVLTLAALFRRHSAVARCWILRLGFPALLMAAFWQFGAGWLPAVYVKVDAPAEPTADGVKQKFDVEAMYRELNATPVREHFVNGVQMPAPQTDILMPYGEPKLSDRPVLVEDPSPSVDTRQPGADSMICGLAVPWPVASVLADPAANPSVPWPDAILTAIDRWWLSWAWFCGTLVVAAWLVTRHAIGLLWLRSRGKAAKETITTTGDALTDALGMKRAIYRQVPGLASPLVTGWLGARLWLPEETIALPETQIRSILHHELAHHRRNDLPWQQLASFACVLWWWNPLVWTLRRHLRHEAEFAADEVVVSRDGGHATDYAEALVQVARGWTAGDTRILRRTGVPMMGSTSAIERRVRAILAEHPLPGRVGWTAGVAVVFIAVMGMGVASLTAIAQPAEPSPPAPVVEKISSPPELPSPLEWRKRDEGSGMMRVVELRSLMEQRQNRTPDYIHPPDIQWMNAPSSGPMDLDRLLRLDTEMRQDFELPPPGATHMNERDPTLETIRLRHEQKRATGSPGIITVDPTTLLLPVWRDDRGDSGRSGRHLRGTPAQAAAVDSAHRRSVRARPS